MSGSAINVDIVEHLILTVELSLLLQNKELRFWRHSCLSGSLVQAFVLFTDFIHSSSCTAFSFLRLKNVLSSIWTLGWRSNRSQLSSCILAVTTSNGNNH